MSAEQRAATVSQTTAPAAAVISREITEMRNADHPPPPSVSAGSNAGQDTPMDLLEGRSDVYSLAVKMLSAARPGAALQVYAAMLITFALQVSLLLLLLSAAQNSKTVITATSDDLQQIQLDLMQLQMCSMLKSMQQLAGGNASLVQVPAGMGNCSCLLQDVLEHKPCTAAHETGTQNSSTVPPNATNSRSNNNSTGYGENSTAGVTAAASSGSSSSSSWISSELKDHNNNNSKPLSFTLPDKLQEKLGNLPGISSLSEGVEILAVILLSLTVMGLHVMREVVQAASLAYVLAAYGGFIPVQWLQIEHRSVLIETVFQDASPGRFFPSGWCRLCMAFCVPWLQLASAVIAFITAGVLLGMPELRTDRIQLVLNSVALAFILDIDDKAGDVLSWVLGASKMADVPVCMVQGRVVLDQWWVAIKSRWLWAWNATKYGMTIAIAATVLIGQSCAYLVIVRSPYLDVVTDVVTGTGDGTWLCILLGTVLSIPMAAVLANNPFIVPHADEGLREAVGYNKLVDLHWQAVIARRLWVGVIFANQLVYLIAILRDVSTIVVWFCSFLLYSLTALFLVTNLIRPRRQSFEDEVTYFRNLLCQRFQKLLLFKTRQLPPSTLKGWLLLGLVMPLLPFAAVVILLLRFLFILLLCMYIYMLLMVTYAYLVSHVIVNICKTLHLSSGSIIGGAVAAQTSWCCCYLGTEPRPDPQVDQSAHQAVNATSILLAWIGNPRAQHAMGSPHLGSTNTGSSQLTGKPAAGVISVQPQSGSVGSAASSPV